MTHNRKSFVTINIYILVFDEVFFEGLIMVRILKISLITIGVILLVFLAFVIIMPERCIGVSAYIDDKGNCVYD